ncbi:MAG: VCBS repeat-containing protein [Gammaproteobacteria bacterium]|nr:VCBS repeat-containing protein [Gammaproteobacteria bacterium]
MTINLPSKQDPRWKVLGLQTLFVALGITLWGFNRSPLQITFIIATCVVLDMALHYILRGRQWLFPLSACITGMGLSILTNFSHGLWLAIIPPFFAIVSKYLFTVNGKHIYNPALFGVVMALFFSNGMITPSPAYQWGGSGATVFFVITAALMLFALNIRRTTLIISFLVAYTLQLALRAWLMRHHIPPETLFMGTFSAPAFYLFTFFMITDPKTSPDSHKGQIFMAVFIVIIDLILHKFQGFSTLFFAGFIYFTLMGLWQWFKQRKELLNTQTLLPILKSKVLSVVLIGVIFISGWGAYTLTNSYATTDKVNFHLTKIPTAQTGVTGKKGDVLDKVDPQLRHVGKWLLSIGDAVAIADVNADGLPDMFLTQPLKSNSDRAQLYINQGNFRFEKFPLPALDKFRQSPEKYGLIANALWFDEDNDGDQDLLLSVGFGQTVFLQNTLTDTGQLGFIDKSQDKGLSEYQVSVTANVLDMNQDGYLDIILGNVMHRYLPDYDKPTRFNIFSLPKPENTDDRRMLKVMHDTWHNANNGDQHFLYMNNQGHHFSLLDSNKLGFSGTRWTLAIATGDLNDDGWPDLYFANDFGPDELYINQQGKKFQAIIGKLVGEVGRDTYKGMNATFGDIDGNGYPDIHVSNVHEKLQAEGSLLWMNQGDKVVTPDSFVDKAMQRNALNERRFGWGAAFADIDRDGKLDILQANGMMDDAYDEKREKECPDYWYWNAQIALTPPDVHAYADRWADTRGRCIFHQERNRVYLNKGDYFVDVADTVGWEEKGTSRGIATADFDNDGDLDTVVTHMTAPPSIFRQDSKNDNAWVGLKLIGDGQRCNTDAIGSKITLEQAHNGKVIKQYRQVYAANGLSAQSEKRLLFGLGKTDSKTPKTVTVKIKWCGQSDITTLQLPTYRYHTVRQEK